MKPSTSEALGAMYVSLSDSVNTDAFKEFVVKRLNAQVYYLAGSAAPFFYRIPLPKGLQMIVYSREVANGLSDLELNLSHEDESIIVENHPVRVETAEQFLETYGRYKTTALRLISLPIDKDVRLLVEPITVKLIRLKLRREGQCVITSLSKRVYLKAVREGATVSSELKMLYDGEDRASLGLALKEEGVKTYYKIFRVFDSNRLAHSHSNDAEMQDLERFAFTQRNKPLIPLTKEIATCSQDAIQDLVKRAASSDVDHQVMDVALSVSGSNYLTIQQVGVAYRSMLNQREQGTPAKDLWNSLGGDKAFDYFNRVLTRNNEISEIEKVEKKHV